MGKIKMGSGIPAAQSFPKEEHEIIVMEKIVEVPVDRIVEVEKIVENTIYQAAPSLDADGYMKSDDIKIMMREQRKNCADEFSNISKAMVDMFGQCNKQISKQEQYLDSKVEELNDILDHISESIAKASERSIDAKQRIIDRLEKSNKYQSRVNILLIVGIIISFFI